YVKDQPLKIADAPKIIIEKTPEPIVVAAPKKVEVKATVKEKVPAVPVVKPRIKEIQEIPKSAFLIAAEFRQKENLASVEVDMLKLRDHYVFSLNTINQL